MRLSDDGKTPEQIKIFCNLFPQIKCISQLQSLSVLNIKCCLIGKLFIINNICCASLFYFYINII